MESAPSAKARKHTGYLWVLKVPLFLYASLFCLYLSLGLSEKVRFKASLAYRALALFGTLFTLVIFYLIVTPPRLTPRRWRTDRLLRRIVVLAMGTIGAISGFALSPNSYDSAFWVVLFGPLFASVVALRWWWDDDESSWPYQLGFMAAWALALVILGHFHFLN
jgi:hypothetical protein